MGLEIDGAMQQAPQPGRQAFSFITILTLTATPLNITDLPVSYQFPARSMESPPKKGTRWTRRKEARPQELLAAALDLFVERGYAATRLDDVAARAGVSKGTLYLYFENKEELFKAVVRENMLPLIGDAEQAVNSFEGASSDLFRYVVTNWMENIGNTKLSGITKLIMAESGNFPEVANFYYEEVISRNRRMLVRMLEKGMARGEFRQIDTAQAMNIVVAPIIMLMMWKHSFGITQGETIDSRAYMETYCDLLLHGLTAAVPKAR
jgi:AcrR family transcriptional regulator